MNRRFAVGCLAAVAVASLLSLQAAGQAAAPRRPAIETQPKEALELGDFTRARGVKAVAAEQAGVRVVADPAGRGLLVEFPKQEAFPSVRLWQAEAGAAGGPDWSAYDYLRLSLTNTGTARTTAWVYLYDESATTDAKRGSFGLGIDPGKDGELAVPLGLLYRDDGSGTVDLARMSKVRLAFERQPAKGQVVVRKLGLIKVFDGPKPFLFFDFYGVDRPAAAGTLPVTMKSQYTKQAGYGLANVSGLQAALRAQGKFPVFGDGIGGEKVTFLADVPNGKYEVQAIAFASAGGEGVRCLGYSIDAQGKRVVDSPRTEDAFYSGAGLYWGTDKFHDPTRTMWQQYGRDYFTTHTFQAEVTDGQLRLEVNNGAIYAAWVYPADQAVVGRARVEAIQGEQDWRVDTSMARLADGPDAGTAAEPDAASKARGYILFARHYSLMVYPNRNPRPEEVALAKKLSLAAAPGEYEPTTFAVRPLKDLKNATVEVSDLAAPGGATIPKAAVKVDLVKYFPQKGAGIDYVLTPSYLFPYRPLDLCKDFNRQYWLTVHVPDAQTPGVYAGTVKFQAEGAGAAAEVPIEVRVWPIVLADSPVEHGFWNSRAPNYQVVRMFPDRADALAREVIDAELKDMIAHGAPGNTLPGPMVISVDKDGGNLKLKWDEAKLFAEGLRGHGLGRFQHIGGAGNLVSWMLRNGWKEFSPEFNRAYKDMTTQYVAFWKEQAVRSAFQVTDEPRETELNEWNRNRVDTLKYLRMTREIPGLKTMVTPMGDTDEFGNHYTPLLPLMDVWATHCWAGSIRGIYLAGKEKLAELWFYNDGVDRYQWGWHLWRSDALADFEWCYGWEARGAQPLIDDAIGIGDTVIPWAKGVLPRVNYEWGREGVDDLRYVTTLAKAIAEAPREGPAAETAKEARGFLASVRKVLPEFPDAALVTGAEAGAVYTEGGIKPAFDPWRRQVAEYILALRSGAKPVRVEEAWAALPRQASEQSKTAICLLVDQAPKMDGDLSDPVWSSAPVATDFMNLATKELSRVRTEVRAVCDGKKIYFAFHCVEPKYGELKAYATERDGDVWKDDSVEVFLDTKHDKATYYQIMSNTLGTISDNDTRDGSWDGDVQTAVRKGKGFWDVEIAVGLDSMKAKAAPDSVWGVNFCRDRRVTPEENSSWTYVGLSFHTPANFGTLKFQKAK
jgi:hypothetical protein